MANDTPMWWMRGNGHGMPAAPPSPPMPPPAPPESPPMPERECRKQEHPMPNPSFLHAIAGLTERLRHTDGETLLLLALLWLLYRENADRRLLLALAYIIF